MGFQWIVVAFLYCTRNLWLIWGLVQVNLLGSLWEIKGVSGILAGLNGLG